ncbi:MAG TPA: ABC transporter ATP-binding protein [candidate division Zixibacteria bacterium]|nr:ABC transporter ATP-binding protein [candidate division Zixibacteria bacterium]
MISIRRLQKRFSMRDGAVAAVKDLDLEVAGGEFFVIVGASGSGKTTLLRCVAGLEVPDGGEIAIAGEIVSSDNPPAWVPPQRRGLGMVFQSYAVWPHLTVSQNVALPLAEGAQRVPRAEVASRVREALRLVQLEELADRPATLLSGGQQQRVALARAIAVNSRLLLMDEPLSNLDARLREEVRGKIRDLAKQLGATVLYVTHDQIEAMAIADRIALMQSGEILQVGSPAEIYHRPARAEVAEFFGSVNWLSGVIVEPGVAESQIGKLRLAASGCAAGEKVLLGFRPECLSFAYGHAPGEANVFQARLESSTFLGDQFIFKVKVSDRELVGKNRAVLGTPNASVCLRVDPADVMVFPAEQKTGLEVLEHAQHP